MIKVEEEDVPQALVVKYKVDRQEVPWALKFFSNLLSQRHNKCPEKLAPEARLGFKVLTVPLAE